MPDDLLTFDPRAEFIDMNDESAVRELAIKFKVSQQAMALRLAPPSGQASLTGRSAASGTLDRAALGAAERGALAERGGDGRLPLSASSAQSVGPPTLGPAGSSDRPSD